MLNILFLSPHQYTSTMAFAMESIKALAIRGHNVDIIVSSKAFPPVMFKDSNIRVFSYKDSNTFIRYLYLNFLKKALKQVSDCRYDVVICLSEYSLIIGYLIFIVFNIPYVFYNDELHFGNESKRFVGKIYGFLIKNLERVANRRALFTVTQDPIRGRLLSELNRIPLESLRYLPNSRLGKAKIKKSFYIHDRFGFSYDTKIILWLGGVRPGDGAIEIAKSTEGWPSNYRMVFHLPKLPMSNYMKSVISCHRFGKTYVSTTPIPYEYVIKLSMSASIGLGIYEDQGPNTRFICTSSGKINLFLQYGIPCIVSNFEGLRWVEENGAGLCIDNTSEILSAAQKIFSDYRKYKKQSVETFNKLLNFEQSFKTISEEFEKIFKTKDNKSFK